MSGKKRMPFHRWAKGQTFFPGGPSVEFHAGLLRTDINSIYSLYKYCRLHWPDFYFENHPFMECTGQHQMRRIWAKYLEAVES